MPRPFIHSSFPLFALSPSRRTPLRLKPLNLPIQFSHANAVRGMVIAAGLVGPAECKDIHFPKELRDGCIGHGGVPEYPRSGSHAVRPGKDR
jgi:hypothetical protein